MEKPLFEIYTDGSCNNNYNCQLGLGNITNPSSSVAIILLNEEIYDIYISANNNGTSNSAELDAILNVVKYCVRNKIKNVKIYTDSKYSMKVLNSDSYVDVNKVYQTIFKEFRKSTSIEFSHVDRNSGNKYNVMADSLAREVRIGFKKVLENVGKKIISYRRNE